MTAVPSHSTHAQAILAAACTLPQDFTPEDLVVAAWKRSSEKFALDGYPQYPSVQKVFARLYGTRGVIYRGLIDKVGDRRLCVTGKGWLVHRTGATMPLPPGPISCSQVEPLPRPKTLVQQLEDALDENKRLRRQLRELRGRFGVKPRQTRALRQTTRN